MDRIGDREHGGKNRRQSWGHRSQALHPECGDDHHEGEKRRQVPVAVEKERKEVHAVGEEEGDEGRDRPEARNPARTHQADHDQVHGDDRDRYEERWGDGRGGGAPHLAERLHVVQQQRRVPRELTSQPFDPRQRRAGGEDGRGGEQSRLRDDRVGYRRPVVEEREDDPGKHDRGRDAGDAHGEPGVAERQVEKRRSHPQNELGAGERGQPEKDPGPDEVVAAHVVDAPEDDRDGDLRLHPGHPVEDVVPVGNVPSPRSRQIRRAYSKATHTATSEASRIVVSPDPSWMSSPTSGISTPSADVKPWTWPSPG